MTPPRLASRVVAWLAGSENAPYVLDDLADEFRQVAAARGRLAAVRWYRRQALMSVLPLLVAGARRAAGILRVNLRDGVRVLRRAPGLSFAVVAMTSLGIGANTAVFSVVDAVLLRPLPYEDADRLVALWERTPTSARSSVSVGNLADYGRLNDVFVGLAAYSRTTLVVGEGALAEEVAAERIAWDLFDVLGVRPARGRPLSAGDAEPGAAAVAIVSDAFWRQRLGGDPRAVGRPVVVDGRPHVVAGVLGPDFVPLSRGAAPAELFVPAPRPSPFASRGDRNVRVVGRLSPDLAVGQAQAALDRVSATLASEYPDTNRDVSAVVASLPADIAGNARRALVVLLAAVALTVLVACVNVANLLLVWSSGRERDTAVRFALGASRADLLRAALVRGLVFGAAGAAAGILVGVWVRDLLVGLAPASVIPPLGPIALNARVLTVAVGLSLATGAAASLLPALQVTRRRLTATLGDSAVAVAGGRSVLRWRGALLTLQVAAAVVLALGAGLLTRSLLAVTHVDLGFDADRVMAMRIRLPALRYPDAESRLRFFEALQVRLAAEPGVEAAAFANQFPLLGGWGGDIVADASRGPIEGETDLQAVSPDYFEALGMNLRRGRTLTVADRTGAEAVALVSETFAARFFPGEDAVGRTIRREAGSAPIRVVGVVGDVRRDGRLAPLSPQVYLAAAQPAVYAADLSAVAIKAGGDPIVAVPAIRRAVAAIDPALVVSAVVPLERLIQAEVASLRFHTWLLVALGAPVVALAVAGIYGVVTFVAAARTREVGVRLALGATQASVMRVMVGSGLGWTAAGVVLGLAIAAAGSRVLSSLLYETSPFDAGTFGLVALGSIALAGVAAWLPARRTLAHDPIAAIRRI